MKRIAFALLFSLISIPVFAATNCNSVVTDETGTLTGHVAAITNAATNISDLDIRVAMSTFTDSKQYLQQILHDCPAWSHEAHLVLFVGSPSTRKMQIFARSNDARILDIATVRQQVVAPAFAVGDYSGGITSGIKAISQKLQGHNYAVTHPTAKTVVINKQATDMTGFVKVLKIILLLIVLALIGWLVYLFFEHRTKTRAAQQDAIAARNDAATQAINHPNTVAAEQYSQMAGSVMMDPDTPGLGEDDYKNIASAYRRLNWNDVAANAPASSASSVSEPPSEETVPTPPEHHSHHSHSHSHTIVHNTTIINSDPYPYIPTPVVAPVIVEEPVYHDYRRNDDDTFNTGGDDNYGSKNSFTSGNNDDNYGSKNSFTSGSNDDDDDEPSNFGDNSFGSNDDMTSTGDDSF